MRARDWHNPVSVFNPEDAMQRLFVIAALIAAMFLNTSAQAAVAGYYSYNMWRADIEANGSLDITTVNFDWLQFSGDSHFLLLNAGTSWHPVGVGVWVPRPNWPVFVEATPGTLVSHRELAGRKVLCVTSQTGPAQLNLYISDATAGIFVTGVSSWPAESYIRTRTHNSDLLGSSWQPGGMGVNGWGSYDNGLLSSDYYDTVEIGTNQPHLMVCMASLEIAAGSRSGPPAWP